MQRETAMDNFAKAERLELLLEQQGVPILPALSLDGRKMQEIDGEHFYLFDYFPGKALQGNEITAYHCKEMGKVLAEIHSIDKKYENEVFGEMSIDWYFYLAEMKNTDAKLYAMLKDALPVIQDGQNKGNQARKKLPPIVSICHNDMDCNNGRLEWLEYNIKRVLGIGCGADEKEIGRKQVEETLHHIIYYFNMRDRILEHCSV